MTRRDNLGSAFRTWFASPAQPIILVSVLLLILSVLVGYSLARINFIVAALLVIAIPVSILYLRQPFAAVALWLILGPFFVIAPDAATRAMYWLTHRTIIPLAAIFALVTGLIQKRFRFDWIDLSLLAYVLINTFSVLYYYPSTPELYHVYDWVLVGSALFWLIRTTAPREAQLKRLMVAFVVMSIVQGSVGLMMNIPATRAILPEHWVGASSERTTGTLGRVAEFSSTLTASMLLVAHYVFNIRKRLTQILCLIALLPGSLCLVLSFSRGTWLASAIVAVLVIVLYRRMAPYVLTVAAIILLVLTTNIFADSVAFAAERLGYQRTIDSRITSNYAALRMIAAKPLLGWGYGNFTRYHLDFVKPVGGVAATDVHISSHHTYLGMAVELGLLGLITYLMPWLLLLKRSIPVYKQLPQEGFYSRYLLVALWFGVVFWFVVTNFMNMRLAAWGMTWVQLLLGLIASITDAGQELAHRDAADSAARNSLIT